MLVKIEQESGVKSIKIAEASDGLNAYQLAVKNDGFVGDYDAWRVTLKGDAGSDANVTSENIANALGYTPADDLEVVKGLYFSDNEDITNKLQNAINSYKHVSIKSNGNFIVSTTITMPSNSSLHLNYGVVLKQIDGMNDEILTNSDYVGGNYNILIHGEGTFDCNGTTTTRPGGSNPNDFQGTGLLFKNVNGLKIRNITVKDPLWFGIQIGKAVDFSIENITFNYNLAGGDCVHINGQSHFGYVKNIKTPFGIARDDMFALIAKDAAMYNIYEGEISNIKCEGIFAKDSFNAVRIISAGYKVEKITVTGIYGKFQQSVVNIDDFRDFIVQAGESIIRDISISEVHTEVPTNQMGIIRLATKIDSLTVSNLTRTESGSFSTPTFKYDLYCNIDTMTINNVVIDDYTTKATSDHNTGIYIANQAVINNLIINNYTHSYKGTNIGAFRGFFIDAREGAVIGTLHLNNVKTNNLRWIFYVSNATLKRILLNNSVFKESSRLIIANPQSGDVSNIQQITISNTVFEADAEAANTFSFNYTFINPIRLVTNNFRIENYSGEVIYIQPSQSISVSLNSTDFLINPYVSTSLITPLADDLIVRKGSSIAMNNTVSIYNGLRFVPLNTNAEYRDAQPTVGTYKRSDRVLNYLPWVGQPKSWICTASGTPGTWVSEGNL